MEKFGLYILLFILFAANNSFAQNTLLAGKIVDENNKPVADAAIEVVAGKKTMKTTADKDGLYYTQLLPAGRYQVRIYANGQNYKTNEIRVAVPGKAERFYNFKLTGNKAIPDIDERDPFMAVAFNKIEANKGFYDDILPPVRGSDWRISIRYDDYIIYPNGIWRVKYLILDSNQIDHILDSPPPAEDSKIDRK
jgi:hypothetical protein